MQAFNIEDVPEELAAYARDHSFSIDVNDLDRRVKALRQIFETPKTNLVYARHLAGRLFSRCVSAGRGDLANEIQRIMYDPSYQLLRDARQKAIDESKRKFKTAMEK